MFSYTERLQLPAPFTSENRSRCDQRENLLLLALALTSRKTSPFIPLFQTVIYYELSLLFISFFLVSECTRKVSLSSLPLSSLTSFQTSSSFILCPATPPPSSFFLRSNSVASVRNFLSLFSIPSLFLPLAFFLLEKRCGDSFFRNVVLSRTM